MLLNLLILFVLLALSSFFSGIELAYFSLPDLKVRTMVAKGVHNAALVQKLKSRPRKLLITILIGNNLVNIGSAAYATVVATSLFGDSGVGIATGVMTLMILVFGEIAPKAFCSTHAEHISTRFAPIVNALFWFLTPISMPLSWLTNRLTGGHQSPEIHYEEEIRAMLDMGTLDGALDSGEKTMIHNIFQLNDVTLKERMVPLSSIIMYAHHMEIEEVREEIIESIYSRMPIYDGARESIVGILHKDDALIALGGDDYEGVTLGSIARKSLELPMNMTLDIALRRIQLLHNHLAVVTDESGKAIGMITLEDILEEVVGDIADETDLDEQFIHRISRDEILALGKASVVDINNFFNTSIKGHRTVEDFLKSNFSPLPKVGVAIGVGTLVFTIEKMVGDKVKVVRVVRG